MKRFLLCCSLLLISIPFLPAQVGPDSASIASYSEEARQMVEYMAYVFNTLGNPTTSPREKDIIISQSYDKIFRDAEVQIEDDLIANRSVVTNKDVQAYLKDIDFFFKSVTFDYLINDVQYDINEEGQWYFLVSSERRLRGITIDGDSVNNSQPRFLEVNLYPEERMLKIASIYTSRVSEREDLTNWWNGLSPEWKRYFASDIDVEGVSLSELLGEDGMIGVGDTLLRDRGKKVLVSDSSIYNLVHGLVPDQPFGIGDSVKIPRYDTLVVEMDRILPQLRQILGKRSLDLSGHRELDDASPLSKLRQLRELNLTNTNIRDLVPLRNLAHLQRLDITGTPIYNLKPLRYNDALTTLVADFSELTRLDDLVQLPQLRELSISRTLVGDLTPLAECTNLEELKLDSTMVLEVVGLENLKNLRSLDLSHTNVIDLGPLGELTQLEVLQLQGTGVSSLEPVSSLRNLRVLNCDGTRVLSLSPLTGIGSLRRVYCDKTLVTQDEVDRFHRDRSDVLVIFASAALQEWWTGLSPQWCTILWPEGNPGQSPNREQLQQIVEQDSVVLDGYSNLRTLKPLEPLGALSFLSMQRTDIPDLSPLAEALSLRSLNCLGSPVSSIEPLGYLRQLEYLNIEGTRVSDLSPLQSVASLRVLVANHTTISDLMPLANLEVLSRVEVDFSGATDSLIRSFLHASTGVMVIYATSRLSGWWDGLSTEWKQVFRAAINLQVAPSTDDLHNMAYLREIFVSQAGITSLEPLAVCLLLEKLTLDGTRVSNLGPLSSMKTLRSLSFPRHPVQDLTPISFLPLRYLNCENNPIEDLQPIGRILTMEELICAGTQVDDLSPMASLVQLRHLDCGNTEIKKLNPLEELPALTLLECYNTKVSSRRIEKFKEKKPAVEVVYY